MLVSWNWLGRYVDLTLAHDELVDRLSLSGLNHEGSQSIGDDTVIDLEVTSNRGDCLGHIGVAREIAVLTGQTLKIPTVEYQPSNHNVADHLAVDNQFLAACPRFTARVIQGVKIAPSPEWMQTALRAIGLTPINNVVDVTNYVLMECGQPLHAFDAGQVRGGRLIVRAADDGETLEAIDHKTYTLRSTDCVIADASRALSVAGVMGGISSEVTDATTDIVLEAALFTPLNIRRTARRLKLHSPSSFRFERRTDPIGVDWASRRACQLITELAGGQVESGVLDTAPNVAPNASVTLRPDQVTRLLGLEIATAEMRRILIGLGCQVDDQDPRALQCIPPSWRHDLTREVDLIEEIARIDGYDKIPEDAPIPVAPSAKRVFDSATSRVRGVLTAAGLSEAMTPSVVTEKLDAMVSPWSNAAALQTHTAMLVGSKLLRRSLIPSLLQSRAANAAAASMDADLFEIAHVYLPPVGDDQSGLPTEQYHLGLVAGDDFFGVKGILETLFDRLGLAGDLRVQTTELDGFASGGAVQIHLGDDDRVFGVMGYLSESITSSLKLPSRVVAAECVLDAMVSHANLVPQQQPVSSFPAISRDLNLVLPESIRWSELASIIRSEGGPRLVDLTYQETYRNAEQDGADRKRVLFSMQLQSQSETLSGDDADAIIDAIVRRCESDLDAILKR